MPFPIYRIPYLPLKVIVDCMDKFDLIKLSLCSKRADSLLKVCNKKDLNIFPLSWDKLEEFNNLEKFELCLLEADRFETNMLSSFKLTVIVTDDFTLKLTKRHLRTQVAIPIRSESMSKMSQGAPKNFIIGDNFVPTVMVEKKELVTYWNNKVLGILALLEHFHSNLGMKIMEVEIHGGTQPNCSKNLRKFFQSSLTIENVGIYPTISDDDYKYLLTNVNVVDRFVSDKIVGDDFQFDGKIQAKKVYLEHTPWLTLDHLLSCDTYEEIKFKRTPLENGDINVFMKHWVDGKFPKLKHFLLEIDYGMMYNISLAGLEIDKKLGRNGSVKGKDGAYAELMFKPRGHPSRRDYFIFDVVHPENPDQDESDEDEDEEEEEE